MLGVRQMKFRGAIVSLFILGAVWGCGSKESEAPSGPTGEWNGGNSSGDAPKEAAKKPTSAAIPHTKDASGNRVSVPAPGPRTAKDAARSAGSNMSTGSVGNTDQQDDQGGGGDDGQKGDDGEKGDGDEATALDAMKQRSFARLNADGTVPPNALWNAKLQRDGLLEAQGETPAFDSTSWTFLGPGNIGGRIRAIIIHPNDNNTMWVGSCGGGIWKTTNAGASWFPLDDFMSSMSVGCMAMDPTNPNVLYAGTGEGFFEALMGSSNTATVRGFGIFRTTDGGTTWTQMPSTKDWIFVNRIEIMPSNPNIMLAATDSGLYRSTDAGANWTKTYNAWIYDVDINPSNENIVIIGMHEGSGAALSTNGGVSFTNSGGLSGHRTETAWSKSNPNVVYAAVAAADRVKIYQSTNSGVTFTLKTTGSGISMYSAYNIALWVDPTNVNNLIVGGVNLYRSTNAGINLGGAFGNVHSDHHVVVNRNSFNGTTERTVYFGTDGGIFRADNAYTDSVVELNNQLGITQFYGGAMNNSTGRMVAGAQDNFTSLYTGNTEGWTPVVGGDGGFAAADQSNPNYFYGGYQWIGLARSSDAGVNWSLINGGISDAGGSNCNFISYYLLDPNNYNRMLVCARRLWRSDNVKAATPTWTIIKNAIGAGPINDPPNAHFADNSPFNISTVVIAQGNSDIIWAGHNNGDVWYTTNGTSASPSWTKVDTNAGPLPDRWISRIVIDPNNHSHVYVSIMGWSDDNIWETTNSGATWTRITGIAPRAIPSAPVSALALDPLKPGRLFAGTDIGTFTTWDNGQTWSVVTQGPGTVSIEELVWRNNTQLLAFTYGRGAWQATVTPTNVDIAPSGFSLIRGTLITGGITELANSDDAKMDVHAQFLPGDLELPVVLEVTGTSPQTIANTVTLKVESNSTLPGTIQTIQAFNYDTNQFVTLDSRIISGTDATASATISNNVSSFINPSTRQMKMRVKMRAGAAFFSTNWNGRFDLVGWRINN